MGPDGAKLTGGVGGTQTIDVARDTQAVWWLNHPPYGMVLSLRLEGFRDMSSVEDDLKALYRMARADPGAIRPPSITLSGPVPRTDLDWLIEGIDEDTTSTIRRDRDDARIRQDVSVTLVWDRKPELVVKLSPAQKQKGSSHRTVVVHTGDTLSDIAKRFAVKGGSKAIQKLNPSVRDPRHPKVGTRLKLP